MCRRSGSILKALEAISVGADARLDLVWANPSMEEGFIKTLFSNRVV